jgi:hypothetical protein
MAHPAAAVAAAYGAEPAVFTFNLSRIVGAEYMPMVQDILRMVCIQATIQLMLYLSGATPNGLLTAEFALLVVYVVLGVMLYWLALRRIVAVV